MFSLVHEYSMLIKLMYMYVVLRAVACEICMELFSPVQVHPELALNGVEVFMNASGSIHLMQKMDRRLRAITTAMSARGGVYMYSNHLGCDGARVYYGIYITTYPTTIYNFSKFGNLIENGCRWMLMYSCKRRCGCPWPTIFIERCGYGDCPSKPRPGVQVNFYFYFYFLSHVS